MKRHVLKPFFRWCMSICIKVSNPTAIVLVVHREAVMGAVATFGAHVPLVVAPSFSEDAPVHVDSLSLLSAGNVAGADQDIARSLTGHHTPSAVVVFWYLLWAHVPGAR